MSSTKSAGKKFWKVTLKGNPIMGFTDSQGRVHFSRPMTLHYHPPHNARYTIAGDRQVSAEWYTEKDLKQFGLDAKTVAEQGWMCQRRPDTNVRADNYLSAYIEATSASHAKDRYRKLFKIRDARTGGFTVTEAESGVNYAHPTEPAKRRKKKTQDDPWADID